MQKSNKKTNITFKLPLSSVFHSLALSLDTPKSFGTINNLSPPKKTIFYLGYIRKVFLDQYHPTKPLY